MSQSTLKLKHLEVFNLLKYFDIDDVLSEEDNIVDCIYERSIDNPQIVTFTIILSKGRILYIEYNLALKKLVKIFPNLVLCSIISNSITLADLSNSAPLLLATSLNEIVYVQSKVTPQQLITLTEENVQIYSAFCESEIFHVSFNCSQSSILVVTKNEVAIYRLGFDKYENKDCLFKAVVINLNINEQIDYSTALNKRFHIRFSDFNDNILCVALTTTTPISGAQVQPSDINLEKGSSVNVYFCTITVNKKDYSTKYIKHYIVDSNLVSVKFSSFNEKFFFLLENGVVAVALKNTVASPTEKNFVDHYLYKYALSNTKVKFVDIFVHPSSVFVLVKDALGEFVIFDYTLNIYYIMQNSSITVKLSMSFHQEEEEGKIDEGKLTRNYTTPIKIKCWDFFSTYMLSFTGPNNQTTKNDTVDDFNVPKGVQAVLRKEKILNNSMFIFDKKYIHCIFLEITSSFNQSTYSNPAIDEYQLLKNHLRGQNYESSLRVLCSINNFNQWVHGFLFIINKLCQSPLHILLVKRHIISDVIDNIKVKNFDDEYKNNTVQTLKVLAFTNLLYRCLSIRQYEYAYLIADKLNIPYLLKTIVAHAKQTKFLGIAYLCCHKIEDSQTENDDNVINDINKIVTNSNFVMSQQNIQNILKDIDFLLENNNLNSDYLKEHNTLEMNLNKYLEALNLEMEGKFDEAKEIYKKNGLNYDATRVDKLLKELKNQINEDSIHELNDF